MAKSIIIGSSKKRRGRPTLYEGSEGKGAPQIGLRLPPTELAAVDQWIRKNGPDMSRPQAIRLLVEIGLTVKTAKGEDRPKPKDQKHRAREMAGNAIDKMTDVTASLDEQASRKHRLIKGPEEFQKVRRDRPNRK